MALYWEDVVVAIKGIVHIEAAGAFIAKGTNLSQLGGRPRLSQWWWWW